ncbi:MAG: hypothetical protein KGR98_12980 [Verrucomicrobia bacterium]|nr:hypothetical protein [Verrucomicrobiota bacterium]MDE3099965.1 hypothetical protein [Verrucomicrobiota bacterium]
MKIKTLITTAMVAAGIVSVASATDPVVYLTGSSAFRSTVESALANNSGTNAGGVFDAGTVQWGTWGSSSAGSANYMVFHGTVQGQGVYIDCAWSGSEAGIASACNTTLGNSDRLGNPVPLAGSPETWVAYASATISSGGNVVSSNPNGSNGASLEGSSHGSDLAQADTSQAISWTPYVAGTQTALNDYGTEGVVTFTISRNVQPNPTTEYNDCGNITLPQINVLTSGGVVPAGFISGNPADDDFSVYLVGRNRGSGTRMNYLACSTYGAHNTVSQYSIGYGVEASEPQNPDVLWLTNEANGGYESGGGVAKALSDTGGSMTSGSCQQADPFNGGTGWFAIGYLSPSDALSAGNNGGEPTNYWCTVDGVFSNNQNIENGAWWFWGHEHLYGKYQISGIQDLVGHVLFNGVSKTIDTGSFGTVAGGHDPGIPYTLMNVVKASDTSFPSF